MDYPNHPKTLRLKAQLKNDAADIYPIRLWCYVGRFHSSDGILKGYSAEEIECLIGWNGNATELVTAMLKVGYLVQKGDSYHLHEWLDHEGHLVMFRKRAQRAAFKRWGIKHATSNAKCKITDATSNAPSLPSLPTKPTTNKDHESFEMFWINYPKKLGKAGALKAWKKLNPAEPLLKAIFEALEQQKGCEQWTKENGQFVPYPASWLNGRRWEDEFKTKKEPELVL